MDPHTPHSGDAPLPVLEENTCVGDGELATRDDSAALVGSVCLAKHLADSTNADGYTVERCGDLMGYCARGADRNHEWVRVPPTPLEDITIGKMEDLPPEPIRRSDRMVSTI